MEELNNLSMAKSNDHLIESSANNIIESAINLLNRINEQYDDATANELERRFLNSIRTGDPKKFKRVINKSIESKNENR